MCYDGGRAHLTFFLIQVIQGAELFEGETPQRVEISNGVDTLAPVWSHAQAMGLRHRLAFALSDDIRVLVEIVVPCHGESYMFADTHYARSAIPLVRRPYPVAEKHT